VTTAESQTTPARYATLDAWRGVACLMVIGYHSSLVFLALAPPPAGQVESAAAWVIRLLNVGHLGVPIFFVISGYCIAAGAEAVRQRRRSIGSYFVRRFRRIYPPFWIVVAGSVAFFVIVDVLLWPRLLSDEPWLQPRPWWYSGWQWLGNLTLTETWRHHVIGGPRGHFPGQAWTLCYEEQFYGVVGVLLLISRRYFFPGVVAVSGGTLAAVASHPPWISGFFFDGSWLTFAAGVLVYWTSTHARTTRASLLASAALLALALMSVWLPIPGGTVAFVFSTALLWLHRWDDELSKAWWITPFLYCGQMCYSLYLVHQLLVKAVTQAAWSWGVHSATATLVVTVPMSFAVSIAVGHLCFIWVERRFLNTSPNKIRITGGAGGR
jgi:peptidoglycan/LPS O-acetylase OafA/YrhL